MTSMIEEERLNRIKHAPRMPATLATEYCLLSAGIKPEDIDLVAVGFDRAVKIGVACLRSEGTLRARLSDAILWTARLAQTERRLPFKSAPRAEWLFFNHHLAHAASAFFASGFDQAGIISLDGSGGSESGILGVGRGTSIEILKKIPNSGSWGLFYETFTGLLGFRRHSGEGKLMGLAAYGRPAPEGLPFISWDGEIPTLLPEKFAAYVSRIQPRPPNAPLEQVHRDLAATVQQTLEQVVLRMAQWLNKSASVRKFALAGGTALNCSMNGMLAHQSFVEDLFIQPAAYDAGTALGAALLAHVARTGQRPDWQMRHAYWGQEFSNEEIERELRKVGEIDYWRSSDIFSETAGHLADGRIVGWFQGRSEIGPRALGNRSILADPSRLDMKDRVNLQVKHREPWRPFAPSLQDELAPGILNSRIKSPFMILAFDTPEASRKALISAIHVDGTCRPQTVSHEHNPRFWSLLDAFHRRSGVPALLNTSFNVDSQPIVNSPSEAIDTFLNCGIEMLAIGDFAVVKRTPTNKP